MTDSQHLRVPAAGEPWDKGRTGNPGVRRFLVTFDRSKVTSPIFPTPKIFFPNSPLSAKTAGKPNKEAQEKLRGMKLPEKEIVSLMEN